MELKLVFTNVLFVHGFVSKEHFAVLFPFTQSIAANGVKAIIPVSVEFLFCEPTASLALTGAATVRRILLRDRKKRNRDSLAYSDRNVNVNESQLVIHLHFIIKMPRSRGMIIKVFASKPHICASKISSNICITPFTVTVKLRVSYRHF